MTGHEWSSAGRIHQLKAAGLIAKWTDGANEAVRKPRAVPRLYTDEGQQASTKGPSEGPNRSTGGMAAVGSGETDELNRDNNVRAFTLTDFHGIFMIWAFGLSISLIVFGVEMISRRIPVQGCNGQAQRV